MNGDEPKKFARWILPFLTVAGLCAVFLPGVVKWSAGRNTIPTGSRQATVQKLQAAAAAKHREGTALSTDPLLGTTLDGSAVRSPGSHDRGAVDCIIEPFEVVEIGSSVIGVIKSIQTERGDFVKAGQIVAELESSVEDAAVALARTRAKIDSNVRSRASELQLRERRRQRGGKLFKRDAVSLDARQELDTEADIARYEYYRALEEQRLAELELIRAVAAAERRKIRSPVAGVVVSRSMSPGEIPHEDTILTIAQIDPLRVDVILPAAKFGTIKKGTRATIAPELEGNDAHVASVTIVDQVIDAASGTFGVQLELPNPDFAIPGGLHCRVRFEAD
ncbi:MAG: efflux RND transporter periplasmic adaptor subunit [bacterium]|nr:efflux RND transporter periplasmic adaptor subunit [bacterium]